MGSSMANHLINNRYKLFIYTRTKTKASELLKNGAVWVNSPKEVSEKADVILTIVGFPKDVEEVYYGQDGLIKNTFCIFPIRFFLSLRGCHKKVY